MSLLQVAMQCIITCNHDQHITRLPSCTYWLGTENWPVLSFSGDRFFVLFLLFKPAYFNHFRAVQFIFHFLFEFFDNFALCFYGRCRYVPNLLQDNTKNHSAKIVTTRRGNSHALFLFSEPVLWGIFLLTSQHKYVSAILY